MLLSGFNGPEVVAALHAEHAAGNSTFGIDVATGAPKDLRTDKIQDLYIGKWCYFYSLLLHFVFLSNLVWSKKSNRFMCASDISGLMQVLVFRWVLKLAADAVLTVLKVDQIIMARAAGGPKPKQGGDWDED